ncbi:MAG: radical SAM protein [Bacteroidetes bacterium]|nr:radical SAM protein [Bacteroidota bacterium]
MIAFGPLPSRRLGYSLGINNIPHKVCSYDCIYCQVGLTTQKPLQRKEFYPPEQIISEVQQKIEEVEASGGTIDYLSFVPDGEPTLDIHLGKLIWELKQTGKKVAVFTNATLLNQESVQNELLEADLISLKVDAVDGKAWKRINRSNLEVDLERMLESMYTFSSRYEGYLITESMLVKNINEEEENLNAMASFIATLHADISYIGIPTRPPAVSKVRAPDETILNKAFQIFSQKIKHVEYLIGFPSASFEVSGNVKETILHTTAVHPMREEEVFDLLEKANAKKSLIDQMIEAGDIKKTEHDGVHFYLRTLKN